MLKAKMSYVVSVLSRKPIIWGMPYTYSIELTGICNLSCPECPTGKGIVSRNKTEISMELFHSLIGQIASRATYLMLYLQGEPFLNQHIFEMIKLAKERKIYTCISTNGHFLDKYSATQAITAGLDRIIISMDGVTNEVYQQYRKGGNLPKVLEGIRNLVEEKKSLKSQKPFIILQFIVFKHNEHQLGEFLNISKLLGVNKAEIKTAQLYDFANGHHMMTGLQKYSRYKKVNEKYVLRKPIRNSCHRLWSTGVITTDGIMIPCCYDKLISYPMGSTETYSFKALWKNKEFKRYRQIILKRRDQVDICCNCDQ
jgi:MoaA/NifB/PqqE/SkfB family radical SAM enzyme